MVQLRHLSRVNFRRASLAAALALAGCGYNYRLPGHSTTTVAPITVRAGESLPALSEKLIPFKFGQQLTLSSENPDIADVVFRNRDPHHADIWIIAKKPGTATFHYGDLSTLNRPFADSESRRLGVDLPVSPDDLIPGSGSGWRRAAWMRSQSEAAFNVTVE